MPVAKSFQSLNIITDPYQVDGKSYVKVQNARGYIRQVRWYTDAEYAKMYAETGSSGKKIETKSKKDALGFIDNYITIFKGNTYPLIDWFKSEAARYNALWGWYFPSDKPVPAIIPAGIEACRLYWEDISNPRGDDLGPKDYIQEAIEKLIYEEGKSEYVAEIGDTITVDEMYVESKISFAGSYGPTNLYRMVDANGNVYTWFTSTSPLSEGSTYKLKGQVKKHDTYKREKQTVLTRCKALEVLD